jgi:hypothetical protein
MSAVVVTNGNVIKPPTRPGSGNTVNHGSAIAPAAAAATGVANGTLAPPTVVGSRPTSATPAAGHPHNGDGPLDPNASPREPLIPASVVSSNNSHTHFILLPSHIQSSPEIG